MSNEVERGGLFVVSAPSGGGKTSLTRAAIDELARRQISAEISVSYTTRKCRPGETDGQHYHFVDEAGFVAMIDNGEFFEHAEVFGRRYGTGRAKTEELLARGVDVVLDIDWQGARQVKAQMPDAIGIFILPPSVEVLEKRLYSRGQDSIETIAERMAEAHGEIAHHAEYDYLIVNDNFAQALDELVAVFVARRLSRPVAAARHAGLVERLLDSTVRKV